ncbi:MAG: GNAT family N-acetyltransferase, partial [Clostridia bacterium]|nr:GNAT family N-acetyltransferase [Clostridia bacterium]
MTEYQSLFEVRVATYDDIPDILEITKEAFVKYAELAGIETTPALHETYDDVKRDIDTKIVLVAFSDGTPVGSVRVEVFDDN